MASLNDSSMMSLWSMKLWSQGRSPLHSVEACWVGSAHPIKYQCVISAFYLNIQKEASRDCVRLKKKSIVTDFNRWGMGGGDNPESQSVEEKSACRSVRLSVCQSVRLYKLQGVFKKRSFVIPAPLEALWWSKGLDISQKHCQPSFFLYIPILIRIVCIPSWVTTVQ